MTSFWDDNYSLLAQSYGSYLIAIAAVCVTVLTLVLTLGKAKGERLVLRFLVAALVVATVACFVGGHLMPEAAAVPTPHCTAKLAAILRQPIAGIRLFYIASVNIYVAAVMFLYALALLTLAYQ